MFIDNVDVGVVVVGIVVVKMIKSRLKRRSRSKHNHLFNKNVAAFL